MRILFAGLLAIALAGLGQPARAKAPSFSPPAVGTFSSSDSLLQWMYGYRARPAPLSLPEAVHAMRRLGLLSDDKKNGFFVGFIAGVLGRNPRTSPRLVARMLPMPAKEQGAIIKAIAYSGLPNWRALLAHFRARMPYRKALIDSYLSGEAETLMYVPLEEGPSVIYALWGFYYATGHYQPVVRVISALKWAESDASAGFSFGRLLWGAGEPSLDQRIVGATAKWTLAAHAERHRNLVELYRAELRHREEAVALPLENVIAAAERFEAEGIREEQLAVVEKAKAKQARDELKPSGAVTLGSIAIATGCVIATATGHAEIGVPCVVSGAVFSGVTKYIQSKK
jgi:hypothetical protein